MSEFEKMYMDNEKLAYKFGSSYRLLQNDDLMQCIKMALWKAVKTFDKSKNYAFSTYAYRCMYNEYMYSFRDKNLKIPYTTNVVKDINGDEVSIFEFIEDDKNEDIAVLLDRESMMSLIFKYLDTISESNKDIYIKFQLYGFTQKELGKIYNLSQAQISRTIKLINKNLQEVLKDFK